MIRGTTPTHTFELPFDVDQIKDIRITYAQQDKIALEKNKADCIMNGKTVSVTLSQEDTYSFVAVGQVEVQVKILTVDGKVLANPIMWIPVQRILNTEVLR